MNDHLAAAHLSSEVLTLQHCKFLVLVLRPIMLLVCFAFISVVSFQQDEIKLWVVPFSFYYMHCTISRWIFLVICSDSYSTMDQVVAKSEELLPMTVPSAASRSSASLRFFVLVLQPTNWLVWFSLTILISVVARSLLLFSTKQHQADTGRVNTV